MNDETIQTIQTTQTFQTAFFVWRESEIRVRTLARRLRSLLVMTQTRNAKLWNFIRLNGWRPRAAGQKARMGWQGLPGSAVVEAFECR